jgi:hypothetical protein
MFSRSTGSGERIRYHGRPSLFQISPLVDVSRHGTISPLRQLGGRCCNGPDSPYSRSFTLRFISRGEVGRSVMLVAGRHHSGSRC